MPERIIKQGKVIGHFHSCQFRFMVNLTEQLSMHYFDLEKMESREKPRMPGRWKERLYVLNRNIFYFIYSIL